MTPHPPEGGPPRVRLHAEGGHFWEARGGFSVPVRVIAEAPAANGPTLHNPLETLRAVAALPGVVAPIVALPSLLEAPGVPAGAVIVTDPDIDGVVIPSAVGHEIGMGVRVMALGCPAAVVRQQAQRIVAAFDRAQASARPHLTDDALDGLCTEGATPEGAGLEDASRCHPGVMRGADPSILSAVARARARAFWSTPKHGESHLLIAEAEQGLQDESLHLAQGEAVLLIRDASGDLGPQVTTEALTTMLQTALQHGILAPSPALACAPAHSHAGRDYLAAMACAVNLALAHRRARADDACALLTEILGPGALTPRLIGDHARHFARTELVEREGLRRRVLVHRNGAFPLSQFAVCLAPDRQAAWLASPGPAAPATWSSACDDLPGAGRSCVRVLCEAGIITPRTRLQPVLAWRPSG